MKITSFGSEIANRNIDAKKTASMILSKGINIYNPQIKRMTAKNIKNLLNLKKVLRSSSNTVTCDVNLFFSEPRRRKSKRQKQKERGRRIYRKGKEFEKKAYKFLRGKGFKVHKERIRFKAGEIDGYASKGGRHYAVEAKNTKQKVNVKVVRKLKKKIDRSAGFVKGGVIVSKSGFTKDAEREAKKHDIKTLKYKQKRSKSGWSLF